MPPTKSRVMNLEEMERLKKIIKKYDRLLRFTRHESGFDKKPAAERVKKLIKIFNKKWNKTLRIRPYRKQCVECKGQIITAPAISYSFFDRDAKSDEPYLDIINSEVIGMPEEKKRDIEPAYEPVCRKCGLVHDEVRSPKSKRPGFQRASMLTELELDLGEWNPLDEIFWPTRCICFKSRNRIYIENGKKKIYKVKKRQLIRRDPKNFVECGSTRFEKAEVSGWTIEHFQNYVRAQCSYKATQKPPWKPVGKELEKEKIKCRLPRYNYHKDQTWTDSRKEKIVYLKKGKWQKSLDWIEKMDPRNEPDYRNIYPNFNMKDMLKQKKTQKLSPIHMMS